MPVPAGGMTLARVDEILDFYGPDTMLLIGGNLLAAGDCLAREARRLQETGGGPPLWLRFDDERQLPPALPRCPGPRRLEQVPIHAYKQEDGVPFKDITRRAPLRLRRRFLASCAISRWRRAVYSTLERHEHVHAVLILQGVVGNASSEREVRPVGTNDLVYYSGHDLASVPRRRRRAARLPVHGQCAARQAAAAKR